MLLFTKGILSKENSYVQKEYKIAKFLKRKIYVALVDQINTEDIPIEKVRNRFLNMNIEHLEYVIRSVEQYEGSIRNPRAYCLAALYHASETLESHLANEEKKDF